MAISDRWNISQNQWASIGKSLRKYTSPLVLVFLLQLQMGKTIREALPILYGAALQLAINFVSKFATKSK